MVSRGAAHSLLFMIGAASSLIGGPLSGWIMGHFHEVYGMRGWQWLFLLEGLPSVLRADVLLPNSVESASWLSSSEKQAVLRERARRR